MRRKMFWIAFAVLDLVADLILPFWWALAATIPNWGRELVERLV